LFNLKGSLCSSVACATNRLLRLKFTGQLTVALLLLLSSAVHADVEFVYGGSSFEKDARIVVRGGKVLLTHNEESVMSLIYDTTAQLFRVLNHEEKTYLELSNQTIQMTMQGLESMMPQLQEMSENPELGDRQREMLARIATEIAGRDLDAGAEKQVEATGKEKSILGLTCQVHRLEVGSEVYEACTIAYSTVGLKEEDQGSLRELSGTLGEFSSTVQFHEAQKLASLIGSLDGVVLEAVNGAGEKVVSLKQLTMATRSSSDGEIPRDYVETDLFSIFAGL